MDRILVATDFSTRSDRALRRGMLIARDAGASLTLLHVIDGDQPEPMIVADRAAAIAILETTVRTLRDADGIDADHAIQIADIHSGILAAAEEAGAQLIVMGPHRTRLSDIFVGTTVERVVRRTQLPLLIAVQTPSAPYRRTLLALDRDDTSRSAGRAALDIGVCERTDVVLMHAFDAPAEGMMRRSMESADAIEKYIQRERLEAAEHIRSLAEQIGLTPVHDRIVAINGSPARTILESASNEDADLVVLGSSQRKGFERLLVGSVTEDVIREAHRDVLIVPVS